jgi:hypothetical protein
MKQKWLVIVLLLCFAGIIVYNKRPQPDFDFPNEPPALVEESEPVFNSKVAYFLIFTNGIERDFSAAMYHNLNDNVYIESSNSSRVVVKKEGTTWDDFFKTLPFSLNKECLVTGLGETFCTNETHQLKFYINGERVENPLPLVIKDNERLLISFGTNEGHESQLERLESISALDIKSSID